jgi:murein DD-endopeptidase MepM/ murein hydrolase activator NlpD
MRLSRVNHFKAKTKQDRLNRGVIFKWMMVIFIFLGFYWIPLATYAPQGTTSLILSHKINPFTGVTFHISKKNIAEHIQVWKQQQDRKQQFQSQTSLNEVKDDLEEKYYASSDLAKKVFATSMMLIPNTVAPGDVILVRHQEATTIDWQGKEYALQPFGTGYYTYLPIPITISPGKYSIAGNELTIHPAKFEKQYVVVSKKMESMQQDTARIEADQLKINQARASSVARFLFSEPFLLPLEGRLTTPYGYMRYVNNKLQSNHRAIDLAAPEGTAVYATNDGVVALADALYLAGHSVYLDHGMHLFSQYSHLSKMTVNTGDIVKRGDVIGYVGTTGFSTGPHLHFAIWAQQMPVNPNLFFGKTPFQWIQMDGSP